MEILNRLLEPVQYLFLATAFCAMLATKPSDLLNVGTATFRRVFEVFRCQTRDVFRTSEIASRLQNITKIALEKRF